MIKKILQIKNYMIYINYGGKEKKYCSNCGKELLPNAYVCLNRGAKVGESQINGNSESNQK